MPGDGQNPTNTPPRRPVLAVSVCLFDGAGEGDGDGPRILLVTRGRPPLAGRLSLPGGKVRLGERLEAAARRELTEETGLVAKTLAYVTVHEVISPEIHAAIHVFAGRISGTQVAIAGDDAASVRWMTHGEIVDAQAREATTAGLSAIVAEVLERKWKDL